MEKLLTIAMILRNVNGTNAAAKYKSEHNKILYAVRHLFSFRQWNHDEIKSKVMTDH